MLTRRRAMLATAFTTLFVVPLVAGPARAQQSQPRLRTIATFSILGDFARNVGKNQVDVTSLVGPNGDVHVYEPTPGDVRILAGAAIFFVNGLGLEGWIGRLEKSSGFKGKVVTATKGIKLLQLEREAGGKAKTITDPHAWQSLANGK